MLLLSGPPGSGRTSHILAEVRAALRRGATDVRLLTPTATMAEHLRHQLAREGFMLRPNLILTLSHFIAPLVPDTPQISSPALYLLVEDVVRRLNPPEFSRVAHMSGFSAALAQTIDELFTAGASAVRLARPLDQAPCGQPLMAVMREVEDELARRGLATRAARLERAAAHIRQHGMDGVRTVWMDGFFAFTDAELALVRAIGERADLTITLPAGHDAHLHGEERCFQSRRPRPAVDLFRAATIGQETDEIARRILAIEGTATAGEGPRWRDIGILVRRPENYVPLLRASLERFGIPARFYFSAPLAEHATVRFLSAVVRALLGAWDHAETLAALRLAGQSPAIDRFDFKLRQRIPGRGLEPLQALGEPDARLSALLDDFSALEPWRAARLSPAGWSARLKTLRRLVRPPFPDEELAAEASERWRSQACALSAFDAALEETAGALADPASIPLDEFWKACAAVLRLSPLRLPDRRRDVVHVLSVYEARQWELPVVFVCGLMEKHFPRVHPPDPLLPDIERNTLARAGIRIRTAAAWERQERFLFELATTRATRTLTLSYAEADERGVPTLPSSFLDRPAEARAIPVRPQPVRAPVAPPPSISRPELLAVLAARHAVATPSGLECFLDCPFRFFARYSLELATRPSRPDERLDFLLEGKVVHQVLAEWGRKREPLEPLLERVFAEACAAVAVPPGYRAESVKRQMLDNLRRLAGELVLPKARESITEYGFSLPLAGSLELRGRIDRIDRLAGGRALVIDYKYSGANPLERPNLLQGPLYVLAVQRELGLQPLAMLYCAFRNKPKVTGWQVPADGLGFKLEPLTPEWLAAAEQKTLAAAAAIRAGRIAPSPARADLCARCDYRDVCRYDGAAEAIQAAVE